jgi:predicted Rossmann fold nucleotide-binding protein DprA/Smf involved in DNA uptake
LARGGPIAIEIERLASRGVWITTIGDESYPPGLAYALGDQAPPLLFGVGSSSVATQESLAIVGSRDADDDAISYAESVAASAVKGSLAIVSGAARGIDSAAMTSALEHGGSVIGVLADGLEKRIREPQIRAWLADDRLCLLTPYGSNSGFSVGAAMGRNKLIYGISTWSLVVAATAGQGGTWAGATEALKNDWSSVFYRQGLDASAASRLSSLGALALMEPLPEEITASWLQSQVSGATNAPQSARETKSDVRTAHLQQTLFGGPVKLPARKATSRTRARSHAR